MRFDLADLRCEWDLDWSQHHVNHGSFGATPRVGQVALADWRQRAQRNPNSFYRWELMPAVASARANIAEFLGLAADEVALVRNSTEASNIVLRGMALEPGDEVVVFEQEYGAVTLAAKRAAGLAGARVVEIPAPLEFTDGMLLGAFASSLTGRTRLLVVDHITSMTARVMPVVELSRICREQGVAIAVDASHAPGNVDVDFTGLDADFWFGNLHKWACAPVATGALVIGARQRAAHPALVTSWFDLEPYPLPFDMLGTLDYAPWLATPAVLDFISGFGWQRWRAACRERAAFGRDLLRASLGLPADETALHVPMALVPLGVHGGALEANGFCRALGERHAVQAAVTTYRNELFLRVSGQVYNDEADYQALAAGVCDLLGR
ncbi:MAG: aminotransferase class V-fold PLP-dependent enzyme [Actinomycetales bacterium]|nr:aminotransferase class V-fold PLP-dependent enzyme [Actinomycetales bacterium]